MEKNIKQVTNVSYEYLKALEDSVLEFKKNSKWYYYRNLSFYCTEEDKIVKELNSTIHHKNTEIFKLEQQLEEYKNKPFWRRILNK